jgi:uncharacterized membrane protein YoaK (UPF0700 family)
LIAVVLLCSFAAVVAVAAHDERLSLLRREAAAVAVRLLVLLLLEAVYCILWQIVSLDSAPIALVSFLTMVQIERRKWSDGNPCCTQTQYETDRIAARVLVTLNASKGIGL